MVQWHSMTSRMERGTLYIGQLQNLGNTLTLCGRYAGPSPTPTPNTNHRLDLQLQVCWQKNDMDGNINFSSVSSDGRVVTWQLVKNELQHQDTVQLTIPGTKVQGPEGTQNMAISESVSCSYMIIAYYIAIIL